jgi:hypothetical protein
LANQDANNLLAMLWTWQNGDISRTPEVCPQSCFYGAPQDWRRRAFVLSVIIDISVSGGAIVERHVER